MPCAYSMAWTDCAPNLSHKALSDVHPGVRRHAVRLAEKRLADAELASALPALVKDADAQVRLQLAFTLGEWRDARAGAALASLLLAHADDAYLTAAVLSSVRADNLPDVLAGVLRDSATKAPPERVVRSLLGLAAALADKKSLPSLLRDVTTPHDGRFAPWQMAALAGLLEALDRRGESFDHLADESARRPIERILAQARTTTADRKESEKDRLAALPLLGRDPKQRDLDLKRLGELLVPQNSAGLQAAAVAALGRISDDRVPAILTTAWRTHTPSLKGQVLDLLLSRAAWQRQLLDLIDQKTIPAAQVDASRRQRLLTHRDEKIRAQASKVFEGELSPDRRKVLDSYKEAATLTGDGRRGKTLFTKHCVVCHRLENVGHEVGPDLQAVPNKSPLYLLTEILDPNRNVDTRYVAYLAITRAGRTFTGILASESATSITLRTQEGKEQMLLRSELDELQSTSKSLMPEGLEKELSKQDLADLIAYLTSRTGPPKPK